MLHLTFTAPQPTVRARGRQAQPWENDLAPIKQAVEDGDLDAGRYVIVEKFATGDMTSNKKAAESLARKINNRVEKIGERGYHARPWPLPDTDGQPIVGSDAPYATWAMYDPTRVSDGTTTVVTPTASQEPAAGTVETTTDGTTDVATEQTAQAA